MDVGWIHHSISLVVIFYQHFAKEHLLSTSLSAYVLNFSSLNAAICAVLCACDVDSCILWFLFFNLLINAHLLLDYSLSVCDEYIIDSCSNCVCITYLTAFTVLFCHKVSFNLSFLNLRWISFFFSFLPTLVFFIVFCLTSNFNVSSFLKFQFMYFCHFHK